MVYQMAGVMGVFKTLIIFLMIYLGFKFLGRILMPFMNKAKGGPQGAGSRQGSSQSNDRGEGDVTIEYTKSTQGSERKGGHVEGEYVDFEELD